MITEAVRGGLSRLPAGAGLQVTISIPDGEERAKRTLNARLGILGGLSILGTTGVVTADLAPGLDRHPRCGARCGAGRRLAPLVVLSTGRSSEAVARRELLDLPEEAFIMMGDHVGHAAGRLRPRGVAELVLAAQFAKLVKIACGHAQTHAAVVALDLATLAGWARTAGLDAALSRNG